MLTNDLRKNLVYMEARRAAQELNFLVESGIALTPEQIEALFNGIETNLTNAGQNKTMLGKVAGAVGQVGKMIQTAARAIQDTAPVKFIDKAFNDLKGVIAKKMGKTEYGAQLLVMQDAFRQLAHKYPTTGKFTWTIISAITGLVDGGASASTQLAYLKATSDLLKGDNISNAIGAGLQAGATSAAIGEVKQVVSTVANAVDHSINVLAQISGTISGANTPVKESVGKNLLDAIGYSVIALPLSESVDKNATVRDWAMKKHLNESLGRDSRDYKNSVQLTRAGVAAVLYNIQRIHEQVIKHHQMGLFEDDMTDKMSAAAKTNVPTFVPTPGAKTTSAGPSVQPTSTAQPAATSAGPSVQPTSTAQPAATSDYATKYTGKVGNKFMDRVEGGLNSTANWLGKTWGSITTKFEADRMLKLLDDAAVGTNSDVIAEWLAKRGKVPPEVIHQLYKEMGFPPPARIPGSENTGGDAATTPVASAAPGIDTATPTTKQEKAAVKDFMLDTDALMRDLLNMNNLVQSGYVKYLRDRLDQHFPATATAAQPAAKPDTVLNKETPPGAGTKSSANEFGSRAAESREPNRRVYGGRYIKESADERLAKEFEFFVNRLV